MAERAVTPVVCCYYYRVKSNRPHGQILGGWLAGARFVASPNFDARPTAVRPELIVLHNISLPPGQFGGPNIEQFFSNTLNRRAHPFFEEIAGLRVSAHFLIRRDGEIVQFVPTDRRAWHAGVSQWRGRERCNDFSLGIELEGMDDIPYTDEQYQAVVVLIAVLRSTYPTIASNAIVGHSDVAPSRKTDPGPAFDWARMREGLRALSKNRGERG